MSKLGDDLIASMKEAVKYKKTGELEGGHVHKVIVSDATMPPEADKDNPEWTEEDFRRARLMKDTMPKVVEAFKLVFRS